MDFADKPKLKGVAIIKTGCEQKVNQNGSTLERERWMEMINMITVS